MVCSYILWCQRLYKETDMLWKVDMSLAYAHLTTEAFIGSLQQAPYNDS